MVVAIISRWMGSGIFLFFSALLEQMHQKIGTIIDCAQLDQKNQSKKCSKEDKKILSMCNILAAECKECGSCSCSSQLHIGHNGANG